jgi:uncharacterized secreted protein with C-terminal beta-propeller domain
MRELDIGEYEVYSVDQLLKDKPDRLHGLQIRCNEEPDNYSIRVNEANVFCRDYEIVYGSTYVVIRFLDKYGNVVCNVSASGSSEWKDNECFIVAYNKIISQTSLREINRVVDDAIN